VNSSGATTAGDALICLRKAVGIPQTVTCNCDGITTTLPSTTTTTIGNGCTDPLGCPADRQARVCTSGNFVSQAQSDLDTGWKGLAHNQDLVAGATISIDVVRRCTNDKTKTCTLDSDCPGSTCVPYCDCDDPNNSTCEITGPTQQPRCVNNLAPCTTNGDCGTGVACQRFFGPPLPVSAANVPACITTYFQGNLTGTADATTGESLASANLRSRVHLGLQNDQPCPLCGPLSQNPQVGQTFTCVGGPKQGQSCKVEAVSPVFGGVSSDCPPDVTTNVSGDGLAIIFKEVSTGTLTRTAALRSPINGSPTGPLFCTDTGAACTSNADCLRCTNDTAVACTTNGDCSGGTCAAAPDQPIACGFYSHCGFCNNDPLKPCFDNSDCPQGQTCGVGNSTTGQQTQPNGCSDLVCERANSEECCNSTVDGSACPSAVSTPLNGNCSTKKYLGCTTNTDCANNNAGTCVKKPLPCFGNTITREGAASPLGKYCVNDINKGACNSNADCNPGPCVDDTSEPTTVAMFCVPKTASSAINGAGGIPGPGAITFKGVIFACRCGDGTKGCDEECDDGNLTNGDGCSQACQTE
jgi:cysteine-rich repeat protein